MTVQQIMSAQPITIGPEATLPQILQIFSQYQFRHLLVLEHNRLVGVITDRDIRRALPSTATSLAKWEIPALLEKISAKELMHTPVHTVLENAPISYAAEQMLKHNISCLPVMDGDKLKGIITSSDLLRFLADTQN
ncbi:MAG: CBS domain-containing protein [Deinococcales bacterium]